MVNSSCCVCGETKGLFVWTGKGSVCLPCLSAQTQTSPLAKQSPVKQSNNRKIASMKMEMRPRS